MIAKEFLMQVRSRYEEVQEQKEYVDRIRDSLGVAGIKYNNESCQGSSDPHSREHLLLKMIEEDKRLKKMNKDYAEFRVSVIDMIHNVSDSRDRKILYRVYIDFKSLYEVSSEMSYSYEYTRKIHLEALKNFTHTMSQCYPMMSVE